MPPISICSSESIKLTGDHFRFDLVFTQNKQPNPKKRPETEPKPAQTNPFQFGFLCKKPKKPICIFLGFFGFIMGFVTSF